mmetsp:Transcript_35172/g.92610  ORF Transcript_35172/g.92610 Transcript_35172/m.92610 type:complete len:261 (+) Transcript_35172:597-1379(+)
MRRVRQQRRENDGPRHRRELAEAVGGANAQRTVGGGHALGGVDVEALVEGVGGCHADQGQRTHDQQGLTHGEARAGPQRHHQQAEAHDEEEAADVGHVDDPDEEDAADALRQHEDEQQRELPLRVVVVIRLEQDGHEEVDPKDSHSEERPRDDDGEEVPADGRLEELEGGDLARVGLERGDAAAVQKAVLGAVGDGDLADCLLGLLRLADEEEVPRALGDVEKHDEPGNDVRNDTRKEYPAPPTTVILAFHLVTHSNQPH